MVLSLLTVAVAATVTSAVAVPSAEAGSASAGLAGASARGGPPVVRLAAAAAGVPDARSSVADRVEVIVSFARAQVGKPYVWGGTGARGFDCSGLIQKSFGAAGVRLPRGSIAQSGAGRRIGRSELRPGDLVFSNHMVHVQLYIGDGRVIEAARPGTNVRISRMLPDRMINAYVRIPV